VIASVIFLVITVGIPVFALYVNSKRPKTTYLDPISLERAKCESPIEYRLFNALTYRGYYVRTQVPCGKYRIDLALPTYKIAIECDGKAYHSSPAQKRHDARKNAYFVVKAGVFCVLVEVI
jgi:very-short-patch-repair endonuclease